MATKTKKPAPSSNGHIEEETPLRLTKEEVQTTTKYTTREEALSLIGMYYSMQRLRKGAGNKLDAHRRKVDSIQDPLVVMRLKEELKKLEAQAQRALRAFAESSPLGRWCLSLTGVGPISTAALLAHIDLKRCCCTQFAHLHTPDKRKDIPPHECPGLATAGRIWSFAGLIDPREIVWEKGHKRPFNAQLKTICVHPDGHVLTKRGSIPISDVEIGDEVLTHLGRWQRVTKVFVNHHTGVLYGLRSANAGNQVAWLTEGHPVYAASVQTRTYGMNHAAREGTRQSFDWHPVESVKPLWKLSRPVVSEVGVLPAPIVLSGVDMEGGYVAAQGRWNGVPAPRAVSVLKEIQLTPRTMRLFGLYIGEGNVNRNDIMWSFNIDEENLICFVREMLEELTSVPPRTRKHPETRAAQVGVGCKPLAEAMVRLFGRNGDDMTFPTEWLNLPRRLLRSLWQGIMEAEGDHVGHLKNKRISVKNAALARQIVALGRRLKKSVSLHTEPNGACRIRVNQRDDRTPNARSLLTMQYSGPVYNLEVEEDQSYTVEGYAVHNCWNLSTVWNKFPLDRDIYGPADLYIRLLRQRKAQEVERNEKGLFRDQALAHLRDATKKKYNVSIELKECWASGKLPAFALQLRAQRYAVKIFLSHYHTVGRKILGLPEVKPWAQAIGGHADYIPPPHLDMITTDRPRSVEPEPTKNGRAKKT